MRSLLLVGTTIPVLALAVASFVSLPKKLIYNASESAPVGFYWVDGKPISRGDYVVTRVPERVRDLVQDRGYLPPDVPLIKRVVGVEGDIICRRGREILMNGVPIAVAQLVDGLGRPMADWHGCNTLTEDRMFLLQDHPQSFDGRYFGPVDRSLAIGRAMRLRFPRRKREQN